MSAGEKRSALPRRGSWNAGAGLPTRGEGTSRGLSVRPIANSASSATNAPTIAMRTALRPPGRERGLLDAIARFHAIAPIGKREESAERHQHAPAPDPVDERLDVRAHAPCAAAQRIAEGHVDV